MAPGGLGRHVVDHRAIGLHQVLDRLVRSTDLHGLQVGVGHLLPLCETQLGAEEVRQPVEEEGGHLPAVPGQEEELVDQGGEGLGGQLLQGAQQLGEDQPQLVVRQPQLKEHDGEAGHPVGPPLQGTDLLQQPGLILQPADLDSLGRVRCEGLPAAGHLQQLAQEGQAAVAGLARGTA